MASHDFVIVPITQPIGSFQKSGVDPPAAHVGLFAVLSVQAVPAGLQTYRSLPIHFSAPGVQIIGISPPPLPSSLSPLSPSSPVTTIVRLFDTCLPSLKAFNVYVVVVVGDTVFEPDVLTIDPLISQERALLVVQRRGTLLPLIIR